MPCANGLCADRRTVIVEAGSEKPIDATSVRLPSGSEEALPEERDRKACDG